MNQQNNNNGHPQNPQAPGNYLPVNQFLPGSNIPKPAYSMAGPAKPQRETFRIGIVYNGCNGEDIASYNAQFKQINALSKGLVQLVVIGYKPEDDADKILAGVTYECCPPVSIVHYIKQLIDIDIDILFIPLINNVYNRTSENLNKYFEASLARIPVITLNMAPYNQVIQDQLNGFLYDDPVQLVGYLTQIANNNYQLLNHCGVTAQNQVIQQYNYSPAVQPFIEQQLLGKTIQ